MCLNCNRISLSRLRLSRITAYLEQKIWSFFKRRNLTSGNKIFWIRGEIAPKEQFLPFSTIFSVYIFNVRSQITYLFVKFGCSFLYFPQFCKSDMSKYGYLKVFQRVPSTSRYRELTVYGLKLKISNGI